jgi:hypothetical protein
LKTALTVWLGSKSKHRNNHRTSAETRPKLPKKLAVRRKTMYKGDVILRGCLTVSYRLLVRERKCALRYGD